VICFKEIVLHVILTSDVKFTDDRQAQPAVASASLILSDLIRSGGVASSINFLIFFISHSQFKLACNVFLEVMRTLELVPVF
jgi:hypothetical protein